MKTSTFTFYEQTILDNIDFESYGFDSDVSRYDKIKTLYNIFKREYIHENNKHLGEVKLFAEWLQGLPSSLSVPYFYDEIIGNAEKAGIKVKNEEQFCSEYWGKLSEAFFTLKDNL